MGFHLRTRARRARAAGSGRSRSILALLAAAAAVAIVVAVATEALGDDSDRAQHGAAALAAGGCGPRTAATLARVDEAAARRIYTGELSGHEVSLDAAHVTSWQPLLQALAAGNRTAVAAAVHQLVYMPRWHIVRLRVLQGGRVLADIGGPYVTVPVRGELAAGGRVLGSYVMSVQDDAGYEKLVRRFVGVPIDIFSGGRLLIGPLPLATPPRSGSTVTVGGRSYLARIVALRAFPSGPLSAALLIPTDPALERAGCAVVRVRAWGSVARHIAARFAGHLSGHYGDLVDIVRSTTGGYAFVLAGGRELAGGPLPRRLPSSGLTRYRGRSWSVYSWAAGAGAHVFVLAPPH
jgi:hypothetical protein